MKASQSRKQIVETYEKYDRRLTVITFDSVTGNRIMTYSAYGFHDALLLVAKRLSIGMLVRILIDCPNDVKMVRNIRDLDTTYSWYPNEIF